jgi:hypothetical protein
VAPHKEADLPVSESTLSLQFQQARREEDCIYTRHLPVDYATA